MVVKLINRPIEKLCPLEIRVEQFEDNPNIIYKQRLWPKTEAAIRGILKRLEMESEFGCSHSQGGACRKGH